MTTDQTRAAAIANAQSYFDSGAFKTELAALVACPTESQDPRGALALQSYLTELMRPRFEALGFKTELFQNPDAGALGAGPFLLASRIEDPALPTVLSYGHGDVIRGLEGRWAKGRDPWVLDEEGDRLYGRGTADNKSQHLINLRALEAVINARGKLGFNVKFLIETGEEKGSPGLRAFCHQQAEKLKADVLIGSDGPRLQPDTPTIFTGTRGGARFALTVDLREGAHHSGNFGGLLADPAIILCHAIASITDARGQIRVPEWRPTSLTPQIRALLAALPSPESAIPLDPEWGEVGLTLSEKVFGWNSFAVLAMSSGVPEAPVNAIAGSASATCQLRFVVGTEPGEIIPALRRHLDAHGFTQVRIQEEKDDFFPATRLDPESPWMRFATASLAKTLGRAPHVLPNLGGSLPNDAFTEILGLPTLWVPHSYAGCSQHAPNEHVLKPIMREALGLMAGLWADLGAQGAPQ